MRIDLQLLAATAVLASVSAANAAPVITSAVFATPPAGASSPDSITLGAGSIWVAYPGGTTADGTEPTGNSTVVRYAPDGTVQATFSFKGYTDGLNYSKAYNTIAALQNQDGNSGVFAINASTNVVTPATYASTSPTNGYDEVAFTKNGTFLSYTNPAAPGDAIVRQFVPGANPFESTGIEVTDVVTLAQTGLDAFDADSLKVAPNGIDLVQSGGDQGTLLFIHAPGTAGQTVNVVPLTQGGNPVSGLDDTVYALDASGTLYATQTGKPGDVGRNRVLAFDLDNLPSGTLLASIGSLNEIAIVDPTTGALTPLITGLPGIHGLAYVADVPEPATIALFGAGVVGALALRRRR